MNGWGTLRGWYSTGDQDADYRNAAWDVGCTCPMLPAHVHLENCPLYETPEQMAERLDEEHEPRLRQDVEREIDQENRAIRGIEGKFR